MWLSVSKQPCSIIFSGKNKRKEFELQADGGLNTNDEARRNASLLTLRRKTQEKFPAVNKV